MLEFQTGHPEEEIMYIIWSGAGTDDERLKKHKATFARAYEGNT